MRPVPHLTGEPGAIELAAQIRGGDLSALEATDAATARIEALDGPINAVVVRDFERAREAARALDAAGPGAEQPLFGVPMTVKESFAVAGLPSSWGMEAAANWRPPADARVVERLKAAGAVMLGKTNVPPFLADWQAANPLYGVTNNPHDHARVPGGSSGGSAAAVASGMVPCEFGSDIGGSIRVPAHFCGIYGHKPSYGVISPEGQDPPFTDGAPQALAVVGPLARSAADLRLLFDLTAAPALPARDRPLDRLRVLMLAEHPLAPVAADITEAMHGTAEALRTAGAAVDMASELLPDLEDQHRHYIRMLNTTMMRGAAAPDGRQASVVDWFDLLDAQTRNARAWRALFGSYDFVLAPPAGIAAFGHYETTGMAGRKIAIDGAETDFPAQLAWAGLATFPGLPATVAPVSATSDGLPIGVQVIGPMLCDHDCIALAGAIAALVAG